MNGVEAALNADEKKWRAESDVRTLMEADEIRKDKPRYAAAMKCAKGQLAGLEKVSGGK
jgi:hypothetical protein